MFSMRVNGWVYVVICIAAVAPFLIVPYPPIVDFPNHAARLFIACHPQMFSGMYVYKFGVIPDLALDIINKPLCGYVRPDRIVLWTIALAQLSICASLWFIRRCIFGANDVLIFAAPAMSLNLTTMMGYANYVVGIALAFWLIFIVISNPRLRWPWLLTVGTIFGVAVFFSHIFALLFILITMTGVFWERYKDLPLLRSLPFAGLSAGAMFVVPLLLIFLIARSRGASLAISYEAKFRAIIAPFYAGNAMLISIAILSIGILLLMLWKRVVAVSPALAKPLILLLISCILLPCQISEAVDIDARLAVSSVFLAIAGTRLIATEDRSAYLAVALLGVLAVNWTVSVWKWRPFNDQMAEFRRSIDVLPRGAPVFAVMADDGPELKGNQIAYWQITSYGTIDRQIFNPLEFTGSGMQPLEAIGRYLPLDVAVGQPLPPAGVRRAMFNTPPNLRAKLHKLQFDFAADWGRKFPYIVYYDFGGPPNFDPQRLDLLKQGSFFSILVPRPRAGLAPNP